MKYLYCGVPNEEEGVAFEMRPELTGSHQQCICRPFGAVIAPIPKPACQILPELDWAIGLNFEPVRQG